MSFSMEVKEELSKQISKARHCRIAELSAIITYGGKYSCNENGKGCYIKVSTENLTVALKYFILVEKSFKIRPEVMIRNSHNTEYYHIIINDSGNVFRILKATGILDNNFSIITANMCCKRAYMRGAFMVAGTISDPHKSYHLEISAGTEENAERLSTLLSAFDIECKHTIRKNNNIIYVKEGAQITGILSVMEAHVALMNMENIRIYKEIRNSVNRKVNCETANLSKTTEAALRLQQDIIYIRDNMGFGELSEQLREIADIRLQYPDASLKELGDMLRPPLGKSGVNHRLRKLSDIASDLRRQKEDQEYVN